MDVPYGPEIVGKYQSVFTKLMFEDMADSVT